MPERESFRVLDSEANEQQGRLSPDGRWIAYTSDETETGKPEIYVQNFPPDREPRFKTQISRMGGGDPRWRPDGKELYFISTDHKLMAVAVQTDAKFQASQPTPFDVRVSGLIDVRSHYAVTSDGKRFLINSMGEGDELPMIVLLNWTALLKK